MNSDFAHLIDLPALLGVGIVLLFAAIAIAVTINRRRKRSARLRHHFGDEYDLAVRECRTKPEAEEKLRARVKRAEHFTLRDLTPLERTRYLAEWEALQARFLDHPRAAVTEGDELVNSLLQARGFPGGGIEQRAADLSVYCSHLSGFYRKATEVTARAGRNEATTEELRTAMIHYRALFDELLQLPAQFETRALA